MRYLLLITMIMLGGCSQTESQAIQACETFIKKTLDSPSTYNKIATYGFGPSFKSNGREVKMVRVEYDADNKYGTPIRHDQQCLFELDKTGNFIHDDLEYAATMASIEVFSECCLVGKKGEAYKYIGSAEADAAASAAAEAAADAFEDSAEFEAAAAIDEPAGNEIPDAVK